ncbi:hypothetical protein [Lapidilactobacillus wuchangensis]|uniref:hypothetical protein n=1 Tax=Lapidilactobacillus wuchangensis TaxID=2486001 RepID=UPI0013DDC159|nr:hypothetical protein [Lapidilactobacillus wuchangensis]
MEGSCRQLPNYRWCFSTYDKTCIEDFLQKKASSSVGRVPRQEAHNGVKTSSAYQPHFNKEPF